MCKLNEKLHLGVELPQHVIQEEVFESNLSIVSTYALD